MSGNAAGGLSSRHTMPQDEAYERLPPRVRQALQDSLNDYCAAATLAYCRRRGAGETVRWLRGGDVALTKKRGPASTAIACDVPILRANW